ncbi:hypothetical protein F7725_028041 [Dissostichus mawsoni]|uniref:ATP synthase mitochondrial F1 complex assembly factor 1 n=1 Tax=Dissostichus mawsoni TaxID=36200 RepID=A0A7J5XF54_DISMA|nr:hypothetical protein F7725_028041 [Dissostichus mawsoni]
MFVPGDFSGQGPRHQAADPGLVPLQYRAFSVRKEPQLEENPFFDKYQDKIQKLRSTKPQEYKARVETRHDAKKEVLGHSKQTEFIKLMEQETLDSILDLEKIRDMTGGEVSELWMNYYAAKDTISAVIPTQLYDLISSRSNASPMFLYALPQREGYEFFLGQWSGHELHFTSLINVQTMGEHAPSQLILYHYPDLKEEKGVVLMTAEIDPKFITVHQAQCLANQVQLFYGTHRQETFRLVEDFNHHLQTSNTCC